jgi:hypothetical protein
VEIEQADRDILAEAAAIATGRTFMGPRSRNRKVPGAAARSPGSGLRGSIRSCFSADHEGGQSSV